MGAARRHRDVHRRQGIPSRLRAVDNAREQKMSEPKPFNPVLLCLLLPIAIAAVGCTRDYYRLQANQEAEVLVAEHGTSSRWAVPDFSIQMDPRSRYFDPTDPDRPPLPQDDPAAHRYMHCVDGKRGFRA